MRLGLSILLAAIVVMVCGSKTVVGDCPSSEFNNAALGAFPELKPALRAVPVDRKWHWAFVTGFFFGRFEAQDSTRISLTVSPDSYPGSLHFKSLTRY